MRSHLFVLVTYCVLSLEAPGRSTAFPDPASRSTGVVAEYGYRYYVPETGRWVNSDPIGELGGRNLYEFLVNSPIGKLDPNGLFDFWSFSRGVIKGAAIGFGAAVIIAALPFEAAVLATGALVGYTIYQGVQIANSWSRMSDAEQSEIMGQCVGGFAGGAAGFRYASGGATSPTNSPSLLRQPKSYEFPNATSVAPNSGGSALRTVSRWMSRAEYDAMVKAGKVLPDSSGGKYILSEGAEGGIPGAVRPGSVHAEFEIPANSPSAVTDSIKGWEYLYTDKTVRGRLEAARGARSPPDLPPIYNPRIIGGN